MTKRAQFNTKIDEKIYNDDGKEEMVINNKIPGDILVYRYDQGNGYYFDTVVGNIFAKTGINNTSKDRLWFAKKKENDKILKHKEVPDFVPLAVEIMGCIGDRFKHTLQNVAHKLATMRKIEY